jgi:hypothetical protein
MIHRSNTQNSRDRTHAPQLNATVGSGRFGATRHWVHTWSTVQRSSSRCAKHQGVAEWVIASTKCWFNTCPIIDIHIVKRIVMYAIVVTENVTTRMLQRAVQIKRHLCVRYCQETKMFIMWPTAPQTQVAIKPYTTVYTASANNCASLGTHKERHQFLFTLLCNSC